MGVSVAVTRVAAPTSTGNQDITTTDLGGLTPKVVLLIATRAITDGVAADGAGWYMGASDGTNEWAQSYESQHAQASVDVEWVNDATANRILLIHDGTADEVVEATADFVSFIADGVRINWTDAPASAFLVTAIFFAGSDLTAHVGKQDLGNTADALVAITSIGFEADAVITALLDSAGTVNARWGMGVIHNNRAGTVTQRTAGHNNRHTFGTSKAQALMRDDACVVRGIDNGGLDWYGTAQSFDSLGFDVQLANARAPGNQELAWIALRFGASPVVDAKVYTYSTPTGTGSNTDAGAGFEPQFVMYLPNRVAVANTAEADADGGTIGLLAVDGDDVYTNSIGDVDEAADTDSQSLSDDRVNLPTHTGASGQEAAFTSFGATGVTWNWTATDATARQWPGLAIEAEAAGGGDLSVSSSESATIADAASLAALVIPDLAQSEAVTLAENVKAELEIFIQASEAIVVDDSASLAVSDPQVSQAEAVTVADTAAVDLTIEVIQSEAVTVSDAASVTVVSIADLSIAASDDVSVADASALDALLLDVAASDAVTVTDTAGIDLPVGIAESEAVTIADAVSVDPLFINASLSDAVTVVDSPIVVRQVEGELSIVVSDAVGVAEAVTMQNDLPGINVAVDNFDYWVVGVKIS